MMTDSHALLSDILKFKLKVERKIEISLVGKWFEKCAFNEQINVICARVNSVGNDHAKSREEGDAWKQERILPVTIIFRHAKPRYFIDDIFHRYAHTWRWPA